MGNDYTFELNDSVALNAGSDSWREIPAKKEKEDEMLPGLFGFPDIKVLLYIAMFNSTGIEVGLSSLICLKYLSVTILVLIYKSILCGTYF